MKPFTLVLLFCCVLIAVSPLHASPILNVHNGVLMGATAVDVDGTLYDVQFVQDTCFALFSGCPDHYAFMFRTSVLAGLASQALFDQVFIDSEEGLFDSHPEFIAGCSNTPESCGMLTPYLSLLTGIGDVGLFVGTAYNEPARNVAMPFGITSQYTVASFAVWTFSQSAQQATTAVPEPASLASLLCGLIGIALIGRLQYWSLRRKS